MIYALAQRCAISIWLSALHSLVPIPKRERMTAHFRPPMVCLSYQGRVLCMMSGSVFNALTQFRHSAITSIASSRFYARSVLCNLILTHKSSADLKSDHLGLEATNRKIQIEVQIKCAYCGGTVSKSGISKSLVAGCAWP